HPNIIELFDIRHGPEVIFFVMELAETDLYKHIVKHKPDGLDPSEAKRIMVEIGGAVSHMHRLSICHLDLKPENVLLVSARRTVKLCDFGNAAVGYDGGPTVTKLTDFVGSCGFFAPELATNNSYYDGRLADSWSCGVVFYEMLGGF
ncbi:kinase-like domain-containing protein, partial [Pelagophyceae sp. CCMP2097]